MIRYSKSLALSSGLLASLGLAAFAQQGAGARPLSAPLATSVAEDGKSIVMQGTIKFLEESDVAALREGVIDKIEANVNVGSLIKQGDHIAVLHRELAQLKVARQRVAASATGATAKAEAGYKLAMNELAIRENLRKKRADLVTDEEMRLYQARVQSSEAEVRQASEEKSLAQAELALAEQELAEHEIKSPFTGYVTNRMKDPGEAVQANEPVLRLGRADTFRFFGYLPIDSAVKVRIGDKVMVTPEIADGDLPIEKLQFEGKITQVGREVTTVGRTEVQIMAEIENPDAENESIAIGHGLMAGLKGRMTIMLGTAPANAAREPVATQANATPAAR